MKTFAWLLALLAFCMSASAQTTDKTIRIVSPYAPGGGIDVVGRPLAAAWSKKTGNPVYFENKGGGQGTIAMRFVAGMPPDGSTLIIVTTAQVAINPHLFKELPYDVERDFTPIALVGTTPFMLVVNPDVPAKTVAEFVSLARQNSGKFSYASTGPGSGPHLSMELLKSIANIDLLHVPYKGGGEAFTDLMAGRVQAMFATPGSTMGMIQSGKLRAVGVASTQRITVLPNLPTFAESGLPNQQSYVWYALLGPKNMPPATVKQIYETVADLLKAPALDAQYRAAGVEPGDLDPTALTAFIRSESAKWSAVIKTVGVQPE